jgi:hypothetical protein
VALRTAFTELFGLRHPVALAPMGGSAGGALTAAVSAAGGRSSPTWRYRSRCSPPAASPTVAGWPPRWPSARPAR